MFFQNYHVSAQARCKAVVIHDAGDASLDEITMPTVGPFDVAVQVAYVGVCATDLEILDGNLGYYKDRVASYPIVPGHELSGRVSDIGGSVTHVNVGDVVVVECIQGCGTCKACLGESPIGCDERAELGVIKANGGYAEFVVVQERFVHCAPSSVDLKKAALCEPLAVALKGLRRLGHAWDVFPETKKCAVVGAGPLGRLCAMVLAHRGHAITIFDQDERRLEGVGPPVCTSQSLDRLGEFDAIVEATGQQSALDLVLNASRAGVTLLLLGLPYGRTEFSFERLVAYDKTVVGSVGSGPAEFEEALKLLPDLDLSSFTETVLPLEAFQQGWDLARTRSCLKVLLSPAGT